MKTVVLYSHKNAEIVQQLVEGIRNEGLLVWWDKKIADDAKFRQLIQEEIQKSRCVLVVWSSDSINSSWVPDEAEEANRLGKVIVHACLGGVAPPFPFKGKRVEQLSLHGERIDPSAVAAIANQCKKVIDIKGPKEQVLDARVSETGWDFEALALETPVPGMDIFSSFRPCGKDGVFLLMRADSTDGWVNERIPTAKDRHELLKNVQKASAARTSYEDSGAKYLKVKNDVLFIMDPLRPYGIQIGGLRSNRPGADPGTISGDISPEQLSMLPVPKTNAWLYVTLAEILTREDTLQDLYKRVGPNSGLSAAIGKQIRELIAKNPYAPSKLQKDMCLFCRDTFKNHRLLSSKAQEDQYGAFIVANDFPFGPSFHYLAITKDPIHSWEALTYKHIRGINLLLWEFLKENGNTKDAAGISFGFNSTVRHLILGSKTRSSAGASIQHIHKQAWGMPSNGANIAERLIEVSQAYWNHRVDYQENYHNALAEAGYVIWQDKHVCLYVPYGQSSKSELQVMVLEPRGNVLALTNEEIESLSIAEYFVLQIFKKLGINSFNQVVLSKLLHDTRAPKFRLVEAFITRDVDLAVSELSMLFVVDQHPWDSRNEIVKVWDSIKEEVQAAVRGSAT